MHGLLLFFVFSLLALLLGEVKRRVLLAIFACFYASLYIYMLTSKIHHLFPPYVSF